MKEQKGRSADRGPAPGRILVEALILTLVALGVRIFAAWTLGEGAPFGPDGTGVEAAVHLGGHLYPLHVALVGLFGSARTLSIICGTLATVLLYLVGRGLKLGGGGGWLLAFLPLGVYTSALAAGDAPALMVLLLGVALASRGGPIAILGGALSMAAVAVKPVVLPALVLLLARPLSLVGVAVAIPLALGWLSPLVSPMPDGGLLGTWWPNNGGVPPANVFELAAMLEGGLQALMKAPIWTGVVLVPIAALGAIWPRTADERTEGGVRLAVLGPVLGILLVAAMFGNRLEPRYLMASVVALLPWAGAILPRGTEALLLWPTAALLTQVAAMRARLDPEAEVPDLPVVEQPEVDAQALFDESSTREATALRRKAFELAETLPEGERVEVERRPHGREGEMVWPLRVLRPDLKIEVVDP